MGGRDREAGLLHEMGQLRHVAVVEDVRLVAVEIEDAPAGAVGLEELPAFVHVAIDGTIAGRADGWDPETWRPIAENLAEVMSWSRPEIPVSGDPVPYPGTPALI